jgi:penicillin-binding protein A
LDNAVSFADENIKDSILTIAETASGFNNSTKISPLFGALIASSISECGAMPTPTLIDSVVLLDSCALYRAVPQEWRAPIKENTAMEVKALMMRVVQHGTARRSFNYIRNSKFFDEVEYGGKTGTVDNDDIGKVDWFVGFARDKTNPLKRLAVGIVTVHDEYWTVHSSYIAEELFRIYFRGFNKGKKEIQIQIEEEKIIAAQQIPPVNDTAVFEEE